MIATSYQNFCEDTSIFMNKQEFRDQSHLSPINYAKQSNKKRQQSTHYSQYRVNGSPQTTSLAFTPFLIEFQQKQQVNNRVQPSFCPSVSVDYKSEQKQKAIQQNINRQMHLKKGAQFRNIILDKISSNLSQPNPQTEILKVTQKKINNSSFNPDYSDQIQFTAKKTNSSSSQNNDSSSDQLQQNNIINPSLLIFNGKRAFSNASQFNQPIDKIINNKDYTEQGLNCHYKIPSSVNDENINNIITDISTHTSRQKKLKNNSNNFRIQPTSNVAFLNSLYEKRFQPASMDMSAFDKNEKEQIEYSQRSTFQKYSEQKNGNPQRSPLKSLSVNKARSNQNNIPSPFQIQLPKSDNLFANHSILSPQNTIQMRKRELINFVQNQPNSNQSQQKNIQCIELDHVFYDNQPKRSFDENFAVKSNEFSSLTNSPNSFVQTQYIGGFKTLKQRAVSPKDTLQKIKNINRQNIQNMCLSFKKDENNISQPQSTLKTEILRKIRKFSFQQQNNNNNSRGFPYQIQFENKVQQYNKLPHTQQENERLESWEADYRQDTAFGFESYPTQENDK